MQFIHEFMSSPVISLDAQATAQEASKLMCEKKISSILVKEGKEYVGIITKSDLVKRIVAEGLNSQSTHVGSIMSKPLMSLEQYTRRGEAHEYMREHSIKHLVVTLANEVVGIITLENMV
jgi:signal-transduction protein with cAMP-binding, CBS, and nucleotidyltransferase domain